MGEKFWWLYDIVTIIIIALFIYGSAKKGFSKILVSTIGYVVSIVLAFMISNRISGFVYDNFVKETSTEAVKEAIEEYDPSLSLKEIIESQGYGALADENRIKEIIKSGSGLSGLYNYANNSAGDTVDTYEAFSKLVTNDFAEAFGEQIGEKLPPYVISEINEKISGNTKLLDATLNVLISNPDKIPQYVEENFIREPGTKLSQVFLFLILFFIFMAIIGFVAVKASSFGLLNGYDRLDTFFGGVLGIIKAAAAMLAAAAIIKIMIDVAESNGSFLSYEAVSKTFIFRHFFDKIL